VQVFTRKYNLVLKPDAIRWLEALCEHFQIEKLEDVADVMDQIAGELSSWEGRSFFIAEDHPTENLPIECLSVVDAAALEKAYHNLQTAQEHGGTTQAEDEESSSLLQSIRIINAFEMPRLHFNHDRKAFEKYYLFSDSDIRAHAQNRFVSGPLSSPR
jgi:DNA polymerase epsilon subunit 2